MKKILPILSGPKIKNNMKYKCIKEFKKDSKTIMTYGDVIIVNDKQNEIYNLSRGVDYYNITFNNIKDYVVNISDFNSLLYPNPNNEIKCIFDEEIGEITDDELDSKVLSNKFKEITTKLYNTYQKKNEDYGNSFDKTLDKWGLQAAAIRMEDKLNRFSNIVKNGNMKIKDESMMDTLLDLANYAILTVMYLNK